MLNADDQDHTLDLLEDRGLAVAADTVDDDDAIAEIADEDPVRTVAQGHRLPTTVA